MNISAEEILLALQKQPVAGFQLKEVSKTLVKSLAYNGLIKDHGKNLMYECPFHLKLFTITEKGKAYLQSLATYTNYTETSL